MLSHVYLCKREAKRFYMLRRVGGNMTTKAEIGVIRPRIQANECWQPPELEEERNRFSLKSSEDTLILAQ